MQRLRGAIFAVMVSAVLAAPVFASGGREDDGIVELNFLEVLTSPGRTQLIRDLIAEYEALNPEVRINLISPPYEQADNRLTLALNAEEPLDIVEVRDYTIKQFVNNGRLLGTVARRMAGERNPVVDHPCDARGARVSGALRGALQASGAPRRHQLGVQRTGERLRERYHSVPDSGSRYDRGVVRYVGGGSVCRDPAAGGPNRTRVSGLWVRRPRHPQLQ